MMWNRWRAVVAGVVVFTAADALAQRGALRGKLVDEQGAPLEGVVCKAELEGGGGRETSVTSKKNGEFVKAGLQVGNYVVTCEKEGYRALPLGASVSSSEQADLGTNTMYRLAPGELSTEDHARAQELLEKFNMSASSDDPQTMLTSLLELEKMLPDNPEIQFNIASAYEKLEQPDKALEYYGRTTALKPDFYEAWLAMADIQGKKKAWADAASSMKKAVDLKATDPIVLFNYAVYAENAGDVAAAETAYQKTLELDPQRATAHYRLGLIAVNKQENDEALGHFEKFLELAPTDPQAEAAKQVVEALKQKKSQ